MVFELVIALSSLLCAVGFTLSGYRSVCMYYRRNMPTLQAVISNIYRLFMTNLSIDYKDVDDLIPYVNNSRTHSDEQITQVAASIKEFGFTNPILIDENNGIIAGHGRLMAAKKLKLEQVPTITLQGLTDAQRKAYVIADNKLALNAGWDFDLLKIEIESLQEDDFKLDLLGFDADELNGILGFDDIAEEDEEEPEQDYEDNYKEQYGVIIMCKSAEEQEKIFNKMQQNGYEVKVVCT